MSTTPGTRLGVAIVGAGNIAGRYAQDIATYPEVTLLGVTDVIADRAEQLAAQHGIKAYPSLEALLADDAVDLVVNLTTHHAHKAVVEQCLKAGKHVHSEKPLALTTDDARALVALAQAKGLRLGCSPFTHMGEAQQTAWKLIREGRLGTVRAIFAEVYWGRIEAWHPSPEPFYDVGVLFDVGVYPLTLLTTFFGPARRVQAYGRVLYPDRVTREGRPFHISTPDFMILVVELEGGPVLRLTTSFYVGLPATNRGAVAFHGDAGALLLESFQSFDAGVQIGPFGGSYEQTPLLKEPYKGTEWGRAVRDMAQALLEKRPHRATGEHAAHVVEILNAAMESAQQGAPVEVRSRFAPPAPMPWGE